MISILHILDVEYRKHNFNLIGPIVSEILIFKLIYRKLIDQFNSNFDSIFIAENTKYWKSSNFNN